MDQKFNNLINDENFRTTALAALFAAIVLGIALSVYFLFLNSLGGIIAPKERSVFNPFEKLELQAKAAYVFDVRDGKVLYSLNPNEVLPLASLTKIMMAVTAMDLIPANTTITINGRFINEEGDSGLYLGESWHLRDLLNFAMLTSSNDAASAIAATAGSISAGASNFDIGRDEFIRKMNEKALIVGLASTTFKNENGLDLNKTESGAYGTVSDVTKLFAYALKNYPEAIGITKYDKFNFISLSNLLHQATNTDPDVNKIPGILASKTGYTDLSGGNLVVAFDPGVGRPIIVAVLGSTYDGRFEDVEKLTNATMKYIQSR